jgi:hypothetical protein
VLQQIDRDGNIERLVSEGKRADVADDPIRPRRVWPAHSPIVLEVGVKSGHTPARRKQPCETEGAAPNVEQRAPGPDCRG